MSALIDMGSGAALPAPCAALPPLIAQAVACVAMGRVDLKGVSLQARSLLCAIIGCADKADLSRSITVSRQRLCEYLQLSRSSVQRLLSELTGAGLLRTAQVKSRRFGFQVGTIDLAADLAAQLGALIQPAASQQRSPQRPQKEPGGEPSRVSPVAHAYQEAVSDKSSTKSKGACGARFVDNPCRGVARLPQDLEVLLQKGISPAAICKLMGLAKRQGQRLQHVCEAAKAGIEGARNPVAYISSLLKRGLDWAWIARRQAQQEAAVQGEGERAKRSKEAREELLRIGRLIDQSRGCIYEITGSAALVWDLQTGRSRGAIPLVEQTVERWAQALRDGRLLPMSPAS